VDGLLLEVSHEAVANLGRDKVRDEHGVVKDALGREDEQTHQGTGFV